MSTQLKPVSENERGLAILCIEYGLISSDEVALMIEELRKNQRPLAEIILDYTPENEVLKAVAKEIGIKFYDLYSTNTDYLPSDDVLEKADINFLKRFAALPLVDINKQIVVACANPSDVEMFDYIKSRYGSNFSLVLAPKVQILNRLIYFSANENSIFGLNNQAPVENNRANQPTVREVAIGKSPNQEWVEKALARAVSEGASDVHFMFNADKSLLLRFRQDGILNTQRVPAGVRPMEAIGAIVAKCSTMDSANYMEPQDGTFSFEVDGRQIDCRVALMPQLYGPTMIIRLLDTGNMGTRLDDMGFSPEHLIKIREVMHLSQGTILAVGPTGAGKSTTLYGLLKEVNAAVKHVQTVENPVEYRTPLVGQTEIRTGLGERSLTFARALRQILRMDPDVILIGEIRDQETAQVSMQAAITGHLVLSTLHANSAVSAFPRLSNMGIPPYLVAEAMSLVISQRLLRKLHECKVIQSPTPEEIATLKNLRLPIPEKIAHVGGCPNCRGTGYRGRVATAEIVVVDRDLRNAASKLATASELEDLIKAKGFIPILQDGYRHVVNLTTTVNELQRVLGTEDID